LGWLNRWDTLIAGIGAEPPPRSPDVDLIERILCAKKFHDSCAELGETLVCYPEKVRDLCGIFDMIDGYSIVPWENLDNNPFKEENLRKSQVTKACFEQQMWLMPQSRVSLKARVIRKQQHTHYHTVAEGREITYAETHVTSHTTIL
jgi:hypothetical protein